MVSVSLFSLVATVHASYHIRSGGDQEVRLGRPDDSGGQACCYAETAQCLSCTFGMTEEEFCLEYPETIGCPSAKLGRGPGVESTIVPRTIESTIVPQLGRGPGVESTIVPRTIESTIVPRTKTPRCRGDLSCAQDPQLGRGRCRGDLTFQTCATNCPRICGEPAPGACNRGCNRGCHCPPGMWRDLMTDRCYNSASQCPGAGPDVRFCRVDRNCGPGMQCSRSGQFCVVANGGVTGDPCTDQSHCARGWICTGSMPFNIGECVLPKRLGSACRVDAECQSGFCSFSFVDINGFGTCSRDAATARLVPRLGSGRRSEDFVCCMSMSASCEACRRGMTLDDFCAVDPNWLYGGCPEEPVLGSGQTCCMSMDASCEACRRGMTLDDFCAVDPNWLYGGCPE